jgi:hypothetical protein
MKTVFVNPSRSRRRRRRRPVAAAAPRRRRRRVHRRRRRNAGITPFVQNPMIMENPRRRRRHRRNPSMKSSVMDFAWLLAGTVGGAALNRLGLSHVNNFYARNGARVGAAAVLAYFGGKSPMTAAAAGATLAPIVAEIEMQMASSTTATKNPRELAAELSALLEADLSDDADGLEDGDDLEDDMDLEDIDEMTW